MLCKAAWTCLSTTLVMSATKTCATSLQSPFTVSLFSVMVFLQFCCIRVDWSIRGVTASPISLDIPLSVFSTAVYVAVFDSSFFCFSLSISDSLVSLSMPLIFCFSDSSPLTNLAICKKAFQTSLGLFWFTSGCFKCLSFSTTPASFSWWSTCTSSTLIFSFCSAVNRRDNHQKLVCLLSEHFARKSRFFYTRCQ